jgi:hypothetical protein
MNNINFNDYAIKISPFSHSSPSEGMCIMECVAYIQGEYHSDTPSCASPILGKMAIALNDNCLKKDRNRLINFVFRLAGSRKGPEGEAEYCIKIINFYINSIVPIILKDELADEFIISQYDASRIPVTDIKSAKVALETLESFIFPKYSGFKPIDVLCIIKTAIRTCLSRAMNPRRALGIAEHFHMVHSGICSILTKEVDEGTLFFSTERFNLIYDFMDSVLPKFEEDVSKIPKLEELVELTV